MTPIRLMFLVLLLGITSIARAEEKVISAPAANFEAQGGLRTLIDVRFPMEWKKTGVPVGAKQISIEGFGGTTTFVSKVTKIVGGNKNIPISLICARGTRSSAAALVLSEAGFTDVKNVREGFLGNQKDGPGWLKHKLPIRTCGNC
jgi:rhodanese-related sulfurtransferase